MEHIIRKRKPGEVFIDLEGKIVVTFNGLKMKNVDSGEVVELKGLVTKKLITDLQLADGTIRTSPDNHVAYSNKAKSLAEISTKLENDEYRAISLLHYDRAIILAEDAGDFIQKATYLARKANLLLKSGDFAGAVTDITEAKTIISTEIPSNDAEKISVGYVRNNILNITKLQYVREKIDALSKDGAISAGTKAMLLEEYKAFTDALAANSDGDYKVKLLAMEKRLGSAEEQLAFHEYDINALKDDKANVEDSLDKVQLLLNNGDSVSSAQIGSYIDYLSKFPSMEKIVELITELMKGQEQKIEENIYLRVNEQIILIKSELQENKETLNEHGSKIRDIEIRVNKLAVKIDDIDYEQLEKLVVKNQLEEDEQKQLDAIEADLCKQSFYNSLRWQMNSLYLAATVITTDMVANQKTGTIGTVGGVLKTLGDYTPIAGIAVKLLGEILVGVDKVDQKIKLEIYSKLVTDSHEMSILSERIAAKLAFDLDKINIRTGKFENVVNQGLKLYDNKLVQAGYNVAVADTDEAAGSVYEMMRNGLKKVKAYRKSSEEPKLLECAKRFISDSYDENSTPESRAIADGERKAKIIVKYIVKQIFAEKIEVSGIDNIVKTITEDVKHQYYEVAATSELKETTAHMMFSVEYDHPEAINDLYEKYSYVTDPIVAELTELLGSMQHSAPGDFNS